MSQKEFTDIIIKEISNLDEHSQEALLAYARTLIANSSINHTHQSLQHLYGSLSQEEADKMLVDIEEGCEHIDTHGW